MPSGQKIKEIRMIQGMTQQDLAMRANINLRTIQRIENEEVIPRSYTLKIIARVLMIDESELLNLNPIKNGPKLQKKDKYKLVWLHLSALLLVPTFLIWFFEREHNHDIKHHSVAALNFQLSMLAILLPCLPFAGLPQLVALFTVTVVLINAVRIIVGKSYYYPFSIKILKSN